MSDSFFINTGLQPGARNERNEKPFKRFCSVAYCAPDSSRVLMR
jgi:hypothetical protein